MKNKKTGLVHWIKNSTFAKYIKKKRISYFTKIGFSIFFKSTAITTVFLELLYYFVSFSYTPVFVIFTVCIALVSTIEIAYITSFVSPTLEYCIETYARNNQSDKKEIMIQKYKSYSIIYGICLALLIFCVHFAVQNFPITFHVLYYPIISSVLIIPAFIMYHFVYKPARAGRLPKWLYRWLERKNPHMALPSALTAAAEHTAVHHDAFVDNAEYTIVDDAPEHADA